MVSIRPNGASFQPAHKRPHPRPLRRASRPSCEGCASPLQDVERPAGTARSEVTIRKNLAAGVPERPRRPMSAAISAGPLRDSRCHAEPAKAWQRSYRRQPPQVGDVGASAPASSWSGSCVRAGAVGER